MKYFGTKLKELRKANNISKTQLSKYLNISVTTISRWENGINTPSIVHLYNIAKYFKVSADYLIGLED